MKTNEKIIEEILPKEYEFWSEIPERKDTIGWETRMRDWVSDKINQALALKDKQFKEKVEELKKELDDSLIHIKRHTPSNFYKMEGYVMDVKEVIDKIFGGKK